MRTDISIASKPPRLIPFSDPMVRAVREGLKTQTRRHVGKALPSWATIFESTPEGVLARGRLNNKPISQLVTCRYGKPGDRLAVREALVRIDGLAHYAADGSPVIDVDSLNGTVPWKWSPSRLGAMYMPRYAARTFLEITEVRIERLMEISEVDAIAEGFDLEFCETTFATVSKGVRWEFPRWLDDPETRQHSDESYCPDCAAKEAEKTGWDVDGWDESMSADGPEWCDECGVLLHHSLSEYGIECELMNPVLTAVSGESAAILANLAGGIGCLEDRHHGRLAQTAFATYWDVINGKGSWAADPHVFAITFRVLKGLRP